MARAKALGLKVHGCVREGMRLDPPHSSTCTESSPWARQHGGKLGIPSNAQSQVHLGSAFWDPETQEGSAQPIIPLPRGEKKNPKPKL